MNRSEFGTNQFRFGYTLSNIRVTSVGYQIVDPTDFSSSLLVLVTLSVTHSNVYLDTYTYVNILHEYPVKSWMYCIVLVGMLVKVA